MNISFVYGFLTGKPKTEVQLYLSEQMTGCKAPAKRTSFLIFGEEWTRFPITPIYNKR